MRDLLPDAAKKDWFGQIRELPLWQGVLVALPIVLLFWGGAIGGLVGALGLAVNLRLSRTTLNPAVKALLMVGVALGAAVTVLVIVALLSAVF